MSVNIDGIDRVQLLKALWQRSKVAGYFGLGSGPSFDEAEARTAVNENYVDYFCGRVIKMDLSGHTTTTSTWGYNRDNGAGAAEAVVAAVRASSSSSATPTLDKVQVEGELRADQVAVQLDGEKGQQRPDGKMALHAGPPG